MEGAPQLELRDSKTEKQKAFEDVSLVVMEWGAEFKMAHVENPKASNETADILYEFAKFIREKSEQLLEKARAEGIYKKEQATAKLHEYNLAHIELLNRSAELVAFYPDAIDNLIQTYPWLTDMKRWAKSINE